MLTMMYSVFDAKVGAHLQPFFVRTEAEAVRAFGRMVNDKEHLFGAHPADFALWYIGSFDDLQGIVFDAVDESTPRHVCEGTQVKEVSNG